MKLNLIELEELAKKTSPIPWSHFTDKRNWLCDAQRRSVADVESKKDKDFIKHLVNAFPSILQTLKAYEEAIERLNSIDLCYVDHTETRECNMTICHKCVVNNTSNFWRSERDTILQDLDNKLSKITL